MRAKKAKAFRRLAEQLTTGMPQKRYQRTQLNKDKAGQTIQLISACTRNVYRTLKKGHPLKRVEGEQA